MKFEKIANCSDWEVHDLISEKTSRLVKSEIIALSQVEAATQTAEYRELVISIFNSVFYGTNPYESRLVVTGVGKNANIATKISETMASLGIPSFYLNTTHAPHGDYGFIGPNDGLIHISRSGTTQEMLDVISHVKVIRPKVFQVLVHCNPSATPSGCDVDFCVGKVVEGDEHALAPTASTTALLCLLDAIAVSLSSMMGFERKDFLALHPAGALGKLLRLESQS